MPLASWEGGQRPKVFAPREGGGGNDKILLWIFFNHFASVRFYGQTLIRCVVLGRGPKSPCLLEEEMSQTSLGPSTLTLQLCAGNALICTLDVRYTDVYCIHIHVYCNFQ